MTKFSFFFVSLAVALAFTFSGCASTKILTPQAVNNNIGGIGNLANCQFFLSKDISLQFVADNRQAEINETSGTVEAQRIIDRRSRSIASSTLGILQTKNSTGETLPGYRLLRNDDNGNEFLTLWILFGESDDNAIAFTAYFNRDEDRFELVADTVEYDGLTYSVAYNGDEPPYLKYKILERTIEKTDQRRERGRRVGS
jgi:hypothetical protein